MTFFLPLGVDDAKVDRLPWVSISIAALCLLAFLATWVLPSNPMGVDDEEVKEVLEQVFTHPQLQLSPAFTERFLSARGKQMLAQMRERAAGAPEADDLAALQKALDERCEELLLRADSGPMRRFSLVPSKGLAQVGWLTHLFLHFGWMHLLGNMLFFYLVGPLLEDIWGRPLFAGFYLVGGLAAALAQFALLPSSESMMAGASGAVAACMGAFCMRYAGRKVRIGYFIWIVRIWRGTFPMPAWAWGGLWFASEVLDYILWGNSTGVAVMAHIGGFAFGFGTAVALKAVRVEERFLAPELEKRQGVWTVDPLVTEAQTALDNGDRDAARDAFTRALAARPDSTEAMLGLARMELEDGQVQPGTARVERALQLLVGRENFEPLWRVVEEWGPLLPAERLRPGFAWRVAQAMEGAPEGVVPLAEPLYAAAGAGTGTMAARALLRATELRLIRREQTERARDYLARARTLLAGAPDPALAARLEGLQAEVEHAARPKSISLTPDAPEAREAPAPASPLDAPPPTPRIIPCRLLSLTEKALMVEAGPGQRRSLAVTEILAVAVGLLPAPTPAGAPQRRTVLTDLVVSWGEQGRGPVVLRLAVANLGLPQLYPGVSPREAYGRFLADLLERSSATALPDASSLSHGQYPPFDSEAQLTQHYYGAQA
ncbi:rhomboid family intramembrane serine protease [Myxococcaceae bacterium GXIMD 01537]